MEKILVLATAAIFFVYGFIFVLFPIEALELIVQGTINSTSGITDIRATYGGMSVGVGIVLYLLATSHGTLRIGLASVCVLMMSMAFGRFVGIVLDGNTNIYMYIYLALELAASLVAFLLLKTSRSR